ncbi:RluA family pseudouridine synthase [Tsuneonella sp. YG55]|uniref:Pseudouridine synthase n=1 Tax=Tsuneonella litorea TaxID=2976475 RepID=A0A9X2W0Y8_9SPHN|nr:RluA family pseudouridine synthase [Tsuneonella litorea]MCT2558878.1 RluA family pseudouridine synthase [Tsuneonella litorea]
MGDAEIITGAIASAGRLDKALAEATGLSRERVKSLIADGAVEVGGRRAASASAKVSQGDAYTVALPAPAPLDTPAQDIPLDIVFEDAHLIVVNKPAGLVVHPAAGNLDGTMVNALLHHCAGRLSGINGTLRPGIVHRIDKDTSGLLVVAKSDAAHEGLARQFADHSIERTYLAVTGGQPRPAAGRIEGRIGRSDANRKKMAVISDASSRGKHAVTHYRTLRALGNAAVVECRLETGRTHQVRVHLASIGNALLGDPVYGRTPAPLRPVLADLGFRRQALHASSLGFVHPVTGDRLAFAAELPADMAELIDRVAH